ncbi:hypothetical protein CHS0354_039009 [Potamilus streckersoni]|uniref:Uncharacterized protein n=1 Tax=Potamilus streckersoni TaxID=2493646 RepID=A0AAE0TIA5_9BIVA|nr:hypothetical protein CHS0354_039009 [Potamilus streckersoni]
MRTKLCLLHLALLVLTLDIATPRDMTAGNENPTEDENRPETDSQYGLKLQQRSTSEWTAGNTKCRHGNVCGYHQSTTYSYCYVDYSYNWDYCCTSACDYFGKDYLWCSAGSEWQYCGDAGYVGVDNIGCYYSHKCGAHQEYGKENYFWCYIDHKLNWRKCCAPSSPCDTYGLLYKWCYTGLKNISYWEHCK